MTNKFHEINPMHNGFYALVRAVEVAGNRSRLAEILGVDQSLIWKWLHRESDIPIHFVPYVVAACEKGSDRDVQPWTLRPDWIDGWRKLAQQLRPLLAAMDAEEAEAAAAAAKAEAQPAAENA